MRYNRVLLLLALAFLAALRAPAIGYAFEVLFSDLRGSWPNSDLLPDGEGNLYGTTGGGGAGDHGTIFKINSSGELITLFAFNSTDGASPRGGLIKGSDGMFYGTTHAGGAKNRGTVYRVSAEGELTTLLSFDWTDGNSPYGRLLEGPDGNFYGTATEGGANLGGTIFKVTPGGVLTTLVSLGQERGSRPFSGLIQGRDGNFYGTTAEGGANGGGTVYKMTPAGEYTVLIAFNSANGRMPWGELVEADDGTFYGTTMRGGTGDHGTIFKITSSGEFTSILSFAGTNGSRPYGLLIGSDGHFYGVTGAGGAHGIGVAFKMSLAGVLTPLVHFDSTIGGYPNGRLVEGRDGFFYGANNEAGQGERGRVFKFAPSGAASVIASFDVRQGSTPTGLVEGADGNLYGTTSYGGTNNEGAIFKVTPSGVHTTLASFGFPGGRLPQAPLIVGPDGAFYGTTYDGGAGDRGTIFRVKTTGAVTQLVSFNSTNGRTPFAPLVFGRDGNFYGTTGGGGASNNGTIFRMTLAGVLTTLVNFNSANGSNPRSALVQASDGSFYGTTFQGGQNNSGTIYKVTPEGVLTSVHSFRGVDGRWPTDLTIGSDGNIYGTTSEGGSSNNGTIYKLTPAGIHTTLVSFDGVDGSYPISGLVEGEDGAFYGNTFRGGAYGRGVIFKVTPEGELTNLYSFDGRLGAGPGGTPIVGSDGKLYGTANKLVVWRLSLDNAPTATIAGAEEITADRATVSGTVNANGLETRVIFEYGVTEQYGSSVVADPEYVIGNQPTRVEAVLMGLAPNTKYFYRIHGSNSDGMVVTAAASFTTGNKAPAAEIGDAGGITADKATLSGTVNANGVETRVTFEYGVTEQYGSNIVANPEFVTGNQPTPVTATLTGLAANTRYYYRITASNSAGTVVTAAASFTTDKNAPTVAIGDAEEIAADTATLAGTVNANGAETNVVFEYGLTEQYGRSVAANPESVTGNQSTPVNAVLSGLVPNTRYYYRLKASNSKGTVVTESASFTTDKKAPMAEILGAREITVEQATVSGIVNASGSETTVIFEYGVTDQYGSSMVADPETVTGNEPMPVKAVLTGLNPNTTYYYRMKAANAAGTVVTAVATFTTGNRAPRAADDHYVPDVGTIGPISLTVLDNDADVDGDSLSIQSVSQGAYGRVTIDGATLLYTPGMGFLGRDSFSYTISDGIDTATAHVVLRASAPFARLLHAKGASVPGAGEEGSGIPGEAVFQRFGAPSLNSTGTLAFTAGYTAPQIAVQHSIFVIDPQSEKGSMVVRQGQVAPGTEGALFAFFNDPLLNASGDVAFLATLTGADTNKSNNRGLWLRSANGLEMVARTGAQAPGVPDGARWKRFTSVALSSVPSNGGVEEENWMLAFTGFLKQGSGGVKGNNDLGLWIAGPFGTRLALREGQKLEVEGTDKTLRTFAALKAVQGMPGQGNGVSNSGRVAVQAFFTDRTQALLLVSIERPTGEILLQTVALPGDPVADVTETVAKFGLPTQSDAGEKIAWRGKLRGKANPNGIFERNMSDAETLRLLARRGAPAAGTADALFHSFRNVAVQDDGSALFHAKVSGRGVSNANDRGLWWRRGGNEGTSLQLLAMEGAQPPGVPEGAQWAEFISVGLQAAEAGPLFTAKLVTGPNRKPGPGGVTSSNDQGLWAVDSLGELRLIVREGEEVTVGPNDERKTVKSFSLLTAVTGSSTQRRSFDGDSRIIYLAEFTDGSQAVMQVQLP